MLNEHHQVLVSNVFFGQLQKTGRIILIRVRQVLGVDTAAQIFLQPLQSSIASFDCLYQQPHGIVWRQKPLSKVLVCIIHTYEGVNGVDVWAWRCWYVMNGCSAQQKRQCVMHQKLLPVLLRQELDQELLLTRLMIPHSHRFYVRAANSWGTLG